MSGPEQATSKGVKSRKPLASRSCDNCRQRKVRCDGPSKMPGSQCTHCLTYGEPCTYDQPAAKRGPKNKLVEELKEKVATLEAKLRTLSVCSLCSQPLESTFEGSSESPVSDTSLKSDDTLRDLAPHENEEEDVELLSHLFRRWQISTGFIRCKPKFFGSASNLNLVQSVLAVKEKFLGRPLTESTRSKRENYWEQTPWEHAIYSRRSPYVFPPRDLLTALLDLYFTNVHPTFPVLHRDSFLEQVAEGVHLKDDTCFGAVVLAVLALGSRYSDDPRVMISGTGTNDQNNTLSSGWPFVAQVQIVPYPSEPQIHHVQFYCLMTLFAMGGSTPPMAWVYLGIGIRYVLYHGRYLRAPAAGLSKPEDELWNRAFWSIFVLDGLLSCYIGRSPAVNIEEYDVDAPLEVDDAYWDSGFVQPLGKPSELAFFGHFVRLFQILGKALRRLYATKSMKARMGWTPAQEQDTVAELDSAMNDFLDSVPPHLRWDPKQEGGVFFDQAAVLYTTFYWVQITIHRPHMLRQTALSEPSLFICFSAARAALGVIDIWSTKTRRVASSFLQHPTFIAATVLILNTFATKRAGVFLDLDKDVKHVRNAMKVFKACEGRWQSAGRLWELLQELQHLDGYLSVRTPSHRHAPSSPNANSNSNSNPTNSDSDSDSNPKSFNFSFDKNLNPPMPMSAHSHEPHKPVCHEHAADFRPGTSIEELLSETGLNPPPSSSGWGGLWQPQADSHHGHDCELSSLWLAAPADLMNIDQWDSYVENVASVDSTWITSI